MNPKLKKPLIICIIVIAILYALSEMIQGVFHDFIGSALPYICIGIAIIFIVFWNKDDANR